MRESEAIGQIKAALANAPRNGYVAELHVQVLKHAACLQAVSAREFCDSVGIGQSFGTEFAKMRKIAPRLIAAGLNVERI